MHIICIYLCFIFSFLNILRVTCRCHAPLPLNTLVYISLKQEILFHTSLLKLLFWLLCRKWFASRQTQIGKWVKQSLWQSRQELMKARPGEGPLQLTNAFCGNRRGSLHIQVVDQSHPGNGQWWDMVKGGTPAYIVAGVLCLQMGKDDKFFSGHFEILRRQQDVPRTGSIR